MEAKNCLAFFIQKEPNNLSNEFEFSMKTIFVSTLSSVFGLFFLFTTALLLDARARGNPVQYQFQSHGQIN